MMIQINAGNVQVSEAIAAHREDEVNKAMRHFSDRVTRVEAHLHDDNGPKSGLDKRCTLEVRLAGFDPLTVEELSADMYAAIQQASHKLERAVRHKLERHDARQSQ